MQKTVSISKPTLNGVVKPARIGLIPLSDCAPLLAANKQELFCKEGINVDLSYEVGLVTIR